MMLKGSRSCSLQMVDSGWPTGGNHSPNPNLGLLICHLSCQASKRGQSMVPLSCVSLHLSPSFLPHIRSLFIRNRHTCPPIHAHTLQIGLAIIDDAYGSRYNTKQLLCWWCFRGSQRGGMWCTPLNQIN